MRMARLRDLAQMGGRVSVRRVFVSRRQVYLWQAVTSTACLAVFILPWVATHSWRTLKVSAFQLLAALGLIFIHEGLHFAAFRIAGARKGAVTVRFSKKAFLPYVEVRVPLGIWRYRVAVMLPGLLTGVLPALAGAWLASGPLLVTGAVMTAAAGGDVAVLCATRGIAPGSLVEGDADYAS